MYAVESTQRYSNYGIVVRLISADELCPFILITLHIQLRKSLQVLYV
jgi:hypothetical protein